MLQEIGINKEEYKMALRATVKVSFKFLAKRECKDVFINEYIPKLLRDDLQTMIYKSLLVRKEHMLWELI